jgi:iron complex transport system ATP-binding protein
MENLLNIGGITGGYYNQTVIKNISLEVKRGEFLGIIGPNGSGKSTLLKLISRVLTPEKGEIRLEDKDITQMDRKDFSRKVAFVPQDTLIAFAFSVWEIVLMGRIPHLGRLQFESKNDFLIAENALRLTDVSYLRQKDIDELSAGERQRVIIAKALTQEPMLLLLDEPTSHLDIGHQIQILDLLKRLNREKNLTIVIVLHDLNLASEYCDRLILINKGEVFKQGPVEEVLTYQNIEEVYNTTVIVRDNPVTKKPFVLVVSNESIYRQKRGET